MFQLLYTDVFTSKNGDRAKIPNIAVLITDGGSNIFEDTVEEAKKVCDFHILTFLNHVFNLC